MWEEEAPPPPAPLPRPLLTEDKVARCHLRPGSASPLLLSPPPGCFSGWVLRKYFYSSPERGKFIENWKVKMWNKEEKLNCYLMMIYTCILEFCENNRKFLKALLLWHTLDWTAETQNTINLLVNKPTEIFIMPGKTTVCEQRLYIWIFLLLFIFSSLISTRCSYLLWQIMNSGN